MERRVGFTLREHNGVNQIRIGVVGSSGRSPGRNREINRNGSKGPSGTAQCNSGGTLSFIDHEVRSVEFNRARPCERTSVQADDMVARHTVKACEAAAEYDLLVRLDGQRSDERVGATSEVNRRITIPIGVQTCDSAPVNSVKH